jgi:SAM-dependent methyltransferase
MPQSLFDNNAANYDRARPQYPAELFEELVDYIGPRPCGVDAIEVGPGTGQATAALLTGGMRVTAVELGENLAAFLARKFAAQPRLKVVPGAFEEVPLDAGSADLVIAATAWHWIDPATRTKRAHTLLRPNGVLAVIDTVQVRDPVDRGFFDRTFPIYRRYRPDERRDEGSDAETYEPPSYSEMRESPCFTDVRLWRRRWNQRYDAVSYEALLRSYSDTARMEPAAREGLIRDLIETVKAEPGGTLTRPLTITLVASRRV